MDIKKIAQQAAKTAAINAYNAVIKLSQEQTDVYAFQAWLDANTSDKNTVANQIVNAIEDDVNSLNITLSITQTKSLQISAIVNGVDNPVAKPFILSYLIKKGLKPAQFMPGSKYQGWIVYKA